MSTEPPHDSEAALTSPPEPSTATVPATAHRGITLRAILLGALLIPLNVFWMVQSEWVMPGPYPSTISLFANVVFLLFLFQGINVLLRRFAPRHAFSQSELLTLYTMLAIPTGLAGTDGIPIFNMTIAHGYWFNDSNNWDSFLGAFPDWLVVHDHEVLSGHFYGNSSFYQPAVLRAWSVPILAWTVFVSLLLFVAQCINILLRHQWAERERLSFPIIWLPMEMTQNGDGKAFFTNKLMWMGFACAFSLTLWNGIAFLYPSVPSFPVLVDLTSILSTHPWTAAGWFPVTFYPMVIGLSFLLPVDLLFSCWFFYFFWKGQLVVSSAMAWDVTPDFPFVKEQGFGVVVGLFVFYLWTGRRYYAQIWQEAMTQSARPHASTEALSARGALFGIGAGLLGLFLFCLAAKVAWWVALGFFALYLPMIIVVSRIRAELGSPVHDFHFMGPDNILPRALGTTPFQKSDLTFFTFNYCLTRAHRGDTMPVGLEGLQMARLCQAQARRMFGAILLATVLGIVSTFWAFEHQAYALGASAKFDTGSSFARESFDRLNGWVNSGLSAQPNIGAIVSMVFGFLVTISLLFLRLSHIGFPLHPIGYAVACSWAIQITWVPLFIAWVLKGLTMRYGGIAKYRQFLPFFLGLILGDCVMGCIWALISLLLQARMYNFFGA